VTRFDIQPIADLRSAVRALASGAVDGPEGWSISDVDPMAVLEVFSSGLRLRGGFELIAYRFRASGNGNGVVWAVPAGAKGTGGELPAAGAGSLPAPPRPRGALDDFMDAIEGDGSAWSHLLASLFAREAAELGALWHGVSWGAQTILGTSPDRDGPHCVGDVMFESTGPWYWTEECPCDWRPSVEQDGGGGAVVEFFTHDPVGRETIRLNTDQFTRPTSMSFDRQSRHIGDGGGGIVF